MSPSQHQAHMLLVKILLCTASQQAESRISVACSLLGSNVSGFQHQRQQQFGDAFEEQYELPLKPVSKLE